MNERRRFGSRQRRRLKISIGGRVPAFTSDISPGGFAVEVMQVMPPGTALQGSITLGGREFNFTGEVSWARPGSPHVSLRGRIGVRFTGISNEFYELFRATYGS
jgi:hypothetical protein